MEPIIGNAKWAVEKQAADRLQGGRCAETQAQPVVGGAVAGGIMLTIVSGTNLRDADWWPGTGKRDPYVQVKVVGKHHATFETPVHINTKDPVWNFTHEVQHFVASDVLKFTVYDGGQLTADDIVLGRATLVSEQFFSTGLASEVQLQIAGTAVNAHLTIKIEPFAALVEAASSAVD